MLLTDLSSGQLHAQREKEILQILGGDVVAVAQIEVAEGEEEREVELLLPVLLLLPVGSVVVLFAFSLLFPLGVARYRAVDQHPEVAHEHLVEQLREERYLERVLLSMANGRISRSRPVILVQECQRVSKITLVSSGR